MKMKSVFLSFTLFLYCIKVIIVLLSRTPNISITIFKIVLTNVMRTSLLAVVTTGPRGHVLQFVLPAVTR